MLKETLVAAMIAAAVALPARAASLTVELRGQDTAGGRLMVALAATAAEFPDHASRFAEVPAGSSARFENLPPGDYAIAAFQDVNENGVLDKNALGIPTEPYGFSNDARGWFGPPSWQAARFHLGAADGAVTLTLH